MTWLLVKIARVAARVFAIVVGHVVEDLAGKLNVIVCELANLCVVDAEDLCFFGGAEGEAWDEVHDEEDEAGAEE